MKVAVNKDGHNFFVHINHVVVDRVTPPSQPQNQEPVVKDIKGKAADSARDSNVIHCYFKADFIS